MKAGDCVFIRTVTHYYTGRVVEETDALVVLEDAAWIADTGRFHKALSTGELKEVEPYPDRVTVMKGGMVDVCEWNHPLPREAK